jgi:hypothetical protein
MVTSPLHKGNIMAIQFVEGQVAVSDPNPNGPSAISNVKDTQVKVVKLSSANFSTTGVNTLVAVLPADASILSMVLMVETQLSGNSISAAAIDIGSASGGAQYVSAASAFGAAGANTLLQKLGGVEHYNLPWGPDKGIWVKGTATTGNPTAGELYLIVTYVR